MFIVFKDIETDLGVSHCKGNTLHISLFIAFILRASMAFTKDRLFVGGLGLPQDTSRRVEGGKLIFLDEGMYRLLIWGQRDGALPGRAVVTSPIFLLDTALGECRTLFVLQDVRHLRQPDLDVDGGTVPLPAGPQDHGDREAVSEARTNSSNCKATVALYGRAEKINIGIKSRMYNF
ncbi:hypothetical protein Btru_071110, partial [Bulinus truncatus]